MKFQLFLLAITIEKYVSLIPTHCAINATASRVCCPIFQFYGTPCGFPYRGSCQRINYNREYFPNIFSIDDRVLWPERFFQYVCRCNGNYFGVYCEKCRRGFEGIKCHQRKIVVRRNILSLNAEERRILNSVIVLGMYIRSGYVIPTEMDNELSDPIVDPTWIEASIQYKKVFDHRFASRSTLFKSEIDCANFGNLLDFNHNAVGFLTWHRYMMLDWERELQNIAASRFGVNDFSLPYWDWTDLKRCDICVNDLVGDVGQVEPDGQRISSGSPFHNWTEFCMEPEGNSNCYGCHKSGKLGKLSRRWNSLDFPSLEDVYFTLQQPRFFAEKSKSCDSLHKALEGNCGRPGSSAGNSLFMHNKIHEMIDGSMCCSSTSAWYQIHKPRMTEYPLTGEIPGHGRNSYLVGFLPLITNGGVFTDVRNLGYTYDNYDFSINRFSSS